MTDYKYGLLTVSDGASCSTLNIFGTMLWALRLSLKVGWEHCDASSKVLIQRVAKERFSFMPSNVYSTSSKNCKSTMKSTF